MEQDSESRVSTITDAFVSALRDVIQRQDLHDDISFRANLTREALENRLLGHEPFYLHEYLICWEAAMSILEPRDEPLAGFDGMNAPGRVETGPEQDTVKETSSSQALSPAGQFCFRFLQSLGQEGLVDKAEIAALGRELAERMKAGVQAH